MRYNTYNLEQRIDQKETIDRSTYECGILWVLSILFSDLIEQLQEEGRCFGIVKSYINSVGQAYAKAELQDEVTYKKILYLFKPILLREHRKLVGKHLSPADATICILRKILSILEEDQDFAYYKEVGTISKVIGRLYDNIRNKAKRNTLFSMALTLRTYWSAGVVGKHELDHFTFNPGETKTKELVMEKEEVILEKKTGIIEEIDLYGKKDDRNPDSE